MRREAGNNKLMIHDYDSPIMQALFVESAEKNTKAQVRKRSRTHPPVKSLFLMYTIIPSKAAVLRVMWTESFDQRPMGLHLRGKTEVKQRQSTPLIMNAGTVLDWRKEKGP
jgi:hypothetical protein